MSERKKRAQQGCLTDCVAYYFNVHPERVPLFIYLRKFWNSRLQNYFKSRGYVIRWVLCDKPPSRGTHIICGNSLAWKRAAHVVVYQNGKLSFDPDYPSQWSDKRITHRLIVMKMK